MVSVRHILLFIVLIFGPTIGYVLYAKTVGPLNWKSVGIVGYPLFITAGLIAALVAAKIAKDEWNWGAAYLAFFGVWGAFAFAPYIVLRIPGLTVGH